MTAFSAYIKYPVVKSVVLPADRHIILCSICLCNESCVLLGIYCSTYLDINTFLLILYMSIFIYRHNIYFIWKSCNKKG